MKKYLYLILFFLVCVPAIAGTINSYTLKSPPDDADTIVIYDSDDGSTKRIEVGDISGSGTASGFTDSGTNVYATTTSDNVAIGTTTPTQKLTVVGTVSATAFTGDGSGLTGITSSGWTDGGTNVYNTTTTDTVGIGTTTVSDGILQIGGDNVVIGIGGTNNNATSEGELYVKGDLEVDGTLYGDGSGLTGITSSGWTDGGSNVYTTTSTDSVGIGTTLPSEILTVVGNVSVSGSYKGTGSYSLDLIDSNITFLGTSDSLSTAVSDATAGDTIILGSGTYTISSTVTIDKQLNIIGQGVGSTTLNCTMTSTNCLTVTANNVILSKFYATQSESASVAVIRYDGSAGTVLSGGIIKDVNVNYGGSAAVALRGIVISDANVNLYNVNVSGSGTGTQTTLYSLLALTNSTAEENFTVNVYDSTFVDSGSGSSGSRATRPIYVLDNSATNDIIVNLFRVRSSSTDSNSTGAVTGITTDGSDALSYAEYSYFSGGNADVSVLNSGVYTGRNNILANNTTFGTLLTEGSVRNNILNSSNIGIGTTIPKNRLDVNGGIAIGSSYASYISSPTNGAIIQGNVGIGTSAPGATLDIGTGNMRIGIGTTTAGTIVCVKSISGSTSILGYCTGSLTNSICGTCN